WPGGAQGLSRRMSRKTAGDAAGLEEPVALLKDAHGPSRRRVTKYRRDQADEKSSDDHGFDDRRQVNYRGTEFLGRSRHQCGTKSIGALGEMFRCVGAIIPEHPHACDVGRTPDRRPAQGIADKGADQRRRNTDAEQEGERTCERHLKTEKGRARRENSSGATKCTFVRRRANAQDPAPIISQPLAAYAKSWIQS